MKVLQDQYNLIKEGKGNKAHFMKLARYHFPDLVTPVLTYEDTIKVLRNKMILSEGIGGLVTKGTTPDWHKIFKENIAEAKEAKAIEKEATKEVTDMETRGYDYKDTKNYDNVFGEEFLKGFYTEMGDPKNEGKTVEELRAIVAKNLAKDISHYVKDGQFGVKGLGYTTEAPGLGEPKPAKGKHKSSGYGDLKESVLRSQIYLLVKEVLAENKPEKPKIKPETTSKQPADLSRSEYSHVKPKAPKVKQEDNPVNEMDLPPGVSDRIKKGESVDSIAKDFPGSRKQIEKAYNEEWLPKFEKGLESGDIEEAKKPSAGLTKKEKSTISKKAHAGKDIGKKGKGFEKVAKAAEKQYGSKKAGEKVAAAAMWKSQAAKKK